MGPPAARLVVAIGVLAAFAAPGAARGAAEEAGPAAIVIDDFEDTAHWTAHPADGVELAIGSGEGRQGKALRLDFAFTGGGYAVARRAVALDLPDNYAFRFRIRGEAPPNHIEFKLLDATGENVWWCVRRDVAFPADWQPMTIKKRQVTFAWGPFGGGEIRHVAALEIVVTAGQGGRGTLFVDDLELIPLPPPDAKLPPPRASASSSRHGHGAQRALDGDATSTWSPSRSDARPSFALDFGAVREWGGLVVDWAPNRHASDYIVEASDDGKEWRAVRVVTGGNGGRDYLDCPESESRHVRLRVPERGARELALLEVRWQPLAWSATRESFFEAIAREAPRGCYPRGIAGEQSYWTVTGQDADAAEALLGEDGALEPGKRRFSVEPFLLADEQLITWADGKNEQSLANGSLPVPSVTWRRRALRLEATAFATGEPGASSVVVTYRVRDDSAAPRRLTLGLAIRPFQVNPPAQFLNDPGGVAPIHAIERDGDVVRVNGDVLVRSLTPIADFGATTFDGGDIVADWLRDGRVPPASSVRDERGAASAALLFPFELDPGEEGRVDLVIPLHGAELPPAGAGAAWADEALADCIAAWSERTKRVAIELPHAPHVAAALEAQLGYILVNRAGPAIRPGARAYARSWIRDGALTASALLRLGHPEAARDFLEWYAPHQYENGKIPCVVDSRGADPVPEHDSGGEFVFLVAEVFRYTKDRALAERMWPRVRAAVAYLDSLRATRRTDEYRAPDLAEFFGILPPSISHEGYSAKPMHSYWDDSWAFRGFRDAAWLAGELGLHDERARLEAIRDEFRADLAASVEVAMRRHGIDYIPGCADLGDFDATSTTIALAPTGAAAALPRAALERTFEKYRENFRAREAGADWEAYTPYEIRNIGAHVRLGRRDDALEMLEYFLADQRPAAWRQWPEIVWHDDRRPRFLGDLPHTWVGSDYIRSVLDMLAYVSEEEDAMILGAGVPLGWLADPGIAVRNLPTPWGALDFTMRRDASGSVLTEVGGPIQVPPGGIRVRAPGSAAGEDVVIRTVPGSAVSGP